MSFRKTEKSFKGSQRYTSKWPGKTKGLKRATVISKRTKKSK